MKIVSRLRRALRPSNPTTVAEAYLGEATSHADLENRHREIDRGRFAPRRYPF